MGNPQHLDAIKWGAKSFNDWRRNNPNIEVELSRAELAGADLAGAYLTRANLRETDLSGAQLGRAKLQDADLWHANLSSADLRDANLRGANLRGANLELALLSGADLRHADLRDANLGWSSLVEANLYGANLAGANLTEATLNETILANANLAGSRNLQEVVHLGTSSIDESTLMQSGRMPLKFLEGIGLSEAYLEYLPAIREATSAIQFFSCFIVYTRNDTKFVRQLQQDLRDKGIRVWLEERDEDHTALEEVPIDQGIRIWDKTLLCCSSMAIEEGWPKFELLRAQNLETAAMEETGQKMQMLVPFTVDRTIYQGGQAWMDELIHRMGADFSNSQANPGAYAQEINKLTRLIRGY